MYKPTKEELCKLLDTPIFRKISETADSLGMECYVVGGYVRDIFLERPSTDIDVVVVGKGIEMARAFSKRLGRGAHLSVYANFGTAQVKFGKHEIEFVGARKESYSHDSRNPIVEDGTLKVTVPFTAPAIYTESASPTVIDSGTTTTYGISSDTAYLTPSTVTF